VRPLLEDPMSGQQYRGERGGRGARRGVRCGFRASQSDGQVGVLASDWLAAYVQAARDEERARVLGEVQRVFDRSARRASVDELMADLGRALGREPSSAIVRDARGGAR
jgi:hypothetical protein